MTWLLVEVDVSNELISEVPIKLLGEKVRIQDVLYENLPKFCTACRILGHSLEGCHKNNPQKQPTEHKDKGKEIGKGVENNDHSGHTSKEKDDTLKAETSNTKRLELGQQVKSVEHTKWCRMMCKRIMGVSTKNAFQSLANLGNCDADFAGILGHSLEGCHKNNPQKQPTKHKDKGKEIGKGVENNDQSGHTSKEKDDTLKAETSNTKRLELGQQVKSVEHTEVGGEEQQQPWLIPKNGESRESLIEKGETLASVV
ncbi:hypothetical protein M9H77_18887 [Catharanthus roseus]|uniref:Uncharacterized protein n=1 Tax=Catharanthus roseus TaxID=4058 RepID=A0ACC0B8P7_CATRO|nr:hypothetical protein M9H77_18887 [Catharanthus roseus]